jgi:hypothetical protein
MLRDDVDLLKCVSHINLCMKRDPSYTVLHNVLVRERHDIKVGVIIALSHIDNGLQSPVFLRKA